MAVKSEGFSYAPTGKPGPVVKKGEFLFDAMHLKHAHIHGMCMRLIEAGAVLRFVYDPDPVKVKAFIESCPAAIVAGSEEQVLVDRVIRLIAAAHIPDRRLLQVWISFKRRVERSRKPGRSTWSTTASASVWNVPSSPGN